MLRQPFPVMNDGATTQKHDYDSIDVQPARCVVGRAFIPACLRIGLATAFVFAARLRAVRLVDQDVVVTAGADQTINRFGELVVAGLRRMFTPRLFTTHRQRRLPDQYFDDCNEIEWLRCNFLFGPSPTTLPNWSVIVFRARIIKVSACRR